MFLSNCNFKCSCTADAVIACVIIGVIAAFLQITGAITVTPVFLWAAFGIAVVFLRVLLAAEAMASGTDQNSCMCTDACKFRLLCQISF